MSNNVNQVAVPETEAPVAPVEEQPKVKKPKNVASRIFAFLFAAIAVASLFVPYAIVLQANGVTDEPVVTTFWKAIFGLFNGSANAKLFGVIPVYTNLLLDHGAGSPNNIAGIISACVFYMFYLMLALCVIFGIITIFTSKKAPALFRTTVFFFLYAYSMYALWNVSYVYANKNKFLLDIVSFAGTGLGLITFLILGLKRKGAGALMSFLQFIFSLAVSCVLIFSFSTNTTAIQSGLAALKINAFEIIMYVVVGLCALNIMCAYIRIQAKKGLACECIRYILQLLITGFVSYLLLANKATDKLFMILTIAAAGVSLLQIILCIIQGSAGKKKAKKAKNDKNAKTEEEKPVEEKQAKEQPVEEYVKEEHVEPVPYEGGPIEGVEVAELAEDADPEEDKETEDPAKVAKTENKEEETKTAGYDFYNTKSFDPFIATLSEKERNDFTDLFILRCKGDMPEIPAYVVGEPSKDFFRKIFVYLGKYRDMIPDELLMKIYQFSLKLK